MELLRQLQKEGFEVILGEDNRVGIRPADRITPELARQIRKHKAKLIEALRKQKQADGYQQGSKAYPPKPKNRCYACKEYDWWLSKHGLWVCRVCHPPQPGAEVEPEVYRSLEEQNVDLCTSQESRTDRRYCTGYKPARYVHLEVCKWHIAEGDVNCANCPRLSLKDKEVLMNAFLNRAIAKLNARKAVYYRSSDPPARRALIDSLEKKITETYLSHNVVEFIKIVDKWANLFLKEDNNAD